jgi:hypothetical protein
MAFSDISPLVSSSYFYKHAHRLRLKKLQVLYLELPRSPTGFLFLKALLDPGGGFTSETAARRFQN